MSFKWFLKTLKREFVLREYEMAFHIFAAK